MSFLSLIAFLPLISVCAVGCLKKYLLGKNFGFSSVLGSATHFLHDLCEST